MPNQSIVSKKWLVRIEKLLLITVLMTFLSTALAWRTLTPGIDYIDLKQNYLMPWSHVHVFRINLKYNKLSVVAAKELALKHASVSEYAQYSNALLTINGGFFDENFYPLGLRISDKHLQSPMKYISWWGIFYIKNDRPYLDNVKQFTNSGSQVDFAVQSGPRLLINGRIPALKPGRAERSALGITKNGEVILLVTNYAALSTTELAQLMKAAPLHCIDALNLDGGSSSQLQARIGAFNLNVHGFSNVSDAIVVKKKN